MTAKIREGWSLAALGIARWLPMLGYGAVALVFVGALWLLRQELRSVNYDGIVAAVQATPPHYLLGGAALTILSYLTLTAYDVLGLRYVGKPLSYRRTAFASFISYVFSHNIGLSLFGGLAFRYRIYAAFGLSAGEVTKVAVFCGFTFWLGLITLGGLVFSIWPPPSLDFLRLGPGTYQLIGGVFLVLAAAYVVLAARGIETIRIWRFQWRMPSLGLALAQMTAASLDWLLASATLYVLLPDEIPADFPAFLGVFVLASIAGVIAHVPAGLGILETVMLKAFAPYAGADAILGSLLVYRFVYYLAPLGVALTWMGAYELAHATGVIRGASLAARAWLEAVVPRLMSVLVFVSGAVLLMSGAVPAIEQRRSWLEDLLPLAFIEASHLLGSLTGAALLIVARGLQRRLDGAYHLTCLLLVAGIVFSLIKGIDYEEALMLSLLLLVLAPCRGSFYRRASVLESRFSPGWITAIALTLLSMIWLGVFANKHVEFSKELWWSFTFAGDAPRSLRAAFGAVVGLLLAGTIYLLRPSAPPAPAAASPVGDDVLRLVQANEGTYACLALLGDKQFMFNIDRSAMVMYAREGRTWVAMGDPIGSREAARELVWQFRDLVDRYGGAPVFYQTSAEALPSYVDAGFSLLKIGEEAIVDLKNFSLEGKSFKHLRNVQNRLSRDGWRLRVVPATELASLLPQLRVVSDSWLKTKGTREKRFSLGAFDEHYLRHLPMALIEREGLGIAAFANLWITGEKTELSLDLMRYGDGAPPAVMDFLLLTVMAWGREHGYASLNLGMAPFSGMDGRPLAPLWSRLGAMLYEHGEHFYNFQGLREYKEKFGPEWRPKYLASPPGAALPVILANVASLIGGGLRGALAR